MHACRNPPTVSDYRSTPSRSVFSCALLLLVARPLQLFAEDIAFVPTLDGGTTVFVGPGVADDFDVARRAIDAAHTASGRRYRAVVVKSSGMTGGAPDILPPIVDHWWEARDPAMFNPSADVTIVIDLGDRSVAMDIPPSLLSKAGLDLRALERGVITSVFVPRAKDMRYAEGLAEMVAATDQAITAGITDQARQAEDSRIFRTRTLPNAAAALVAAGIATACAVQRWRHSARRAKATAALAAFKRDVVALSDVLDGSQERHRMLPHTDPDFLTPMRGMTRDTYDAVQDAIRRSRERWLALMEVWDKAQERLASEWFLGTAANDDVLTMLGRAEARPPLDEVAADCRGPLDALETAHERARELATSLKADLAQSRARLEALARRGRSAAAFEPVVAEAARAAALADEDIEPDPIAARGRLEAARGTLAELVTRLDGVEAADDRRQHLMQRQDEVRGRAAARRAEGWLLAEPGANPDAHFEKAASESDLAARLLDAADIETATVHLRLAEEALADAATLLENVAAARDRTEQLMPLVATRLDAFATARLQAETDLRHMQQTYSDPAWGDVADNITKAHEGLERSRQLITTGHAAADPATQHFFRAVAALEEAERQAAWADSLAAALAARRRELDCLAEALPSRLAASRAETATLARSLDRQRTDRARANERCREAERLVEVAGDLLRSSRSDPRQIDRVVDAIDMAVARGNELAAEDEQLARQSKTDIDEADAAIRRAAAWYAEGMRADLRAAQAAIDSARRFLAQQRYEDAVHAAADASQQARLAYANATAEAGRRRQRRESDDRVRQMEESFSRMAKGAGPWVINLPTGSLTGPSPWTSSGSSSQGSSRTTESRSTGSDWNRDIAAGRW